MQGFCGPPLRKQFKDSKEVTSFMDELLYSLHGECAKYSQAVGRYIETGESKESVEAANHIRKIKQGKY